MDAELMNKRPTTGNKFIYRYWDEEGSYIGQTKKSLNSRAGKNGKYYCTNDNKWSRAILEKGFEHFNVEILCECAESEADKEEKKYIKQFDSRNSGYNTTPGGKYYSPEWGINKAFEKYINASKIDDILSSNKVDEFITWYDNLNLDEYDKYSEKLSDDDFEYVTDAISNYKHTRMLLEVYKKLGLDSDEILKTLVTPNINLPLPIEGTEWKLFFKDYELTNSEYIYQDGGEYYGYSDDRFYLYRHMYDKNKFIIRHDNYMTGCGSDYWAKCVNMSN